MTRYQLAKIVDWVGTLKSRKRMQKVVFLLQAKGCPIEADFNLHHYGPYSQELSRLCDEMVQANILVERSSPNVAGRQYSYEVTRDARDRVVEFEAHTEGSLQANRMAPFEGLAHELLHADLRELEIASTVVFFRKQGFAWPVAVRKTCEFKNELPGTLLMNESEELARRILD